MKTASAWAELKGTAVSHIPSVLGATPITTHILEH